MTQAHPLQWPVGKPRTVSPRHSAFKVASIDKATKALLHELRLLGAEHVVISTNMRLRATDGLPYSRDKMPADKGVAVYFSYLLKQMTFACDQWEELKDNIYAIAKTIEALRGIERWGSGDMMQQAFSGFLALPAPALKRDPLVVFGFKRLPASYAEVKARWRELAAKYHPDNQDTHDAEKFEELRQAHEELRKRFNQ